MNNNLTQYNIAYYSQSTLNTSISADIREEPHNSITYGPPTLQALSKQLITQVSSYMLNLGEIIINHNGDHSNINDLMTIVSKIKLMILRKNVLGIEIDNSNGVSKQKE